MVQKGDQLKEKAFQLRSVGQSYSQISKSLLVSKSTLSYWFSRLQWSNLVKQRLVEVQRGKADNLWAANAERRRRMELRHEGIVNSSKIEYVTLKTNPLFILGLSLYWGEGEKTNSGRVSVINTDPKMIQVMANFYRKCLQVPDSCLRVGLFVYEDLDLSAVRRFWSKLLGIPLSQFIKTQVLKSRSKLTQRKSKYGVCSLYFSNTAISIKIREWIKLMGEEALNNPDTYIKRD